MVEISKGWNSIPHTALLKEYENETKENYQISCGYNEIIYEMFNLSLDAACFIL